MINVHPCTVTRPPIQFPDLDPHTTVPPFSPLPQQRLKASQLRRRDHALERHLPHRLGGLHARSVLTSNWIWMETSTRKSSPSVSPPTCLPNPQPGTGWVCYVPLSSSSS